MKLTIELPWPDHTLSPNARPHWAAKARAVKDARQGAKIVTCAEMGDASFTTQGNSSKTKLRWTFYPPSRRKYDLDNIIASVKSYQDGIADALQRNDSGFDSTYIIGNIARNGKVVVEIG